MFPAEVPKYIQMMAPCTKTTARGESPEPGVCLASPAHSPSHGQRSEGERRKLHLLLVSVSEYKREGPPGGLGAGGIEDNDDETQAMHSSGNAQHPRDPIHSVQNAVAFEELITKKLPTSGMLVDVVDHLSNENATGDNFLEAIEKTHHATRRRMPSDVVVVYFSGHGRVRYHRTTGMHESVIVLWDGSEVPVVDLVQFFNSSHYAAYIVLDCGFGPATPMALQYSTSGLPMRTVDAGEEHLQVPLRMESSKDDVHSMFRNNVLLWSAVPLPTPGEGHAAYAIDGFFTLVMSQYMSALREGFPLMVVHALMVHRFKRIQEFFMDGYLGFLENFGMMLCAARSDRESKYTSAASLLHSVPDSGRTQSSVFTVKPEERVDLHKMHLCRRFNDPDAKIYDNGRYIAVHRGSITLDLPVTALVSLSASEENVTQTKLEEIATQAELISRTLKKLHGSRGRVERTLTALMGFTIPDLQAYASGERFGPIRREAVMVETCWISRMWLHRHLQLRAYHSPRSALMFFPNSRLSACEPPILEETYSRHNDLKLLTDTSLRDAQCTSGTLVWVLHAVQSGLAKTQDPRVVVVHISCESILLPHSGEHVLFMADTQQQVGSQDDLRVISSGVKLSSIVESFTRGMPRSVTVYFVLDTSKRRALMPLPSSPSCEERYVDPTSLQIINNNAGPAVAVHLHAAHDMFHSLGVIGCSNFAQVFAELASKPDGLSNHLFTNILGEKLRHLAAIGGQVQHVTASGPLHGPLLECVPPYAPPQRTFPVTLIAAQMRMAGGRAHGVDVGMEVIGDDNDTVFIVKEATDYDAVIAVAPRQAVGRHATYIYTIPTPAYVTLPPSFGDERAFARGALHTAPTLFASELALSPHPSVSYCFESADYPFTSDDISLTMRAYFTALCTPPPPRRASLFSRDPEFHFVVDGQRVKDWVHRRTPDRALSCSRRDDAIEVVINLSQSIPLDEEGIATTYFTVLAFSPAFGIYTVLQRTATSTSTTFLLNLSHMVESPERSSHLLRHLPHKSGEEPRAFGCFRVYVSAEPLSCLPTQPDLHRITKACSEPSKEAGETTAASLPRTALVPSGADGYHGARSPSVLHPGTCLFEYTYIDIPIGIVTPKKKNLPQLNIKA
eukprot:PhM_4_TR13189/c0_g1_i1/m.81835